MMPSRETEEKCQHSTTLIPYSYYECRIPEAISNVPMHWHSEFELNRIMQGVGEFICGDDRFTAREGDFFLFPPNMLHAAYPKENSPLFYQALVFHPVMLGTDSKDRATIECIRPVLSGDVRLSGPITPASMHYAELTAAAAQIFSCVSGNQPKLDLLLKSELLRFFFLSEDHFIPGNTEKNGVSYSTLIRPALEHMMEHFQETITIEELGELTHLSNSYFMGCFKKAVGVGAIEYLTQLRINAACDALSGTTHPVAEIAFCCGYSNLSNFNRQFKKIVGCSPKEYRSRKNYHDQSHLRF